MFGRFFVIVDVEWYIGSEGEREREVVLLIVLVWELMVDWMCLENILNLLILEYFNSVLIVI